MTQPGFDAKALLLTLFEAAVAAADPMHVLPAQLPRRPDGRVLVIGAGKAAARMAEAVEASWGPCEGLVITRQGHARPTQRIEVVESAHPIPDAADMAATQRILDLLAGSHEGDFVLALISGGASALLVAPLAGISLEDRLAINRGLITSGATIRQINLVRKHMSRVKGGRLAATAWPAQMLVLVVSDVPDDDPTIIGSGLTVGETSSADDALRILDQCYIAVPPHVRTAMLQAEPPPQPGDPGLSRCQIRIIATPAHSLEAAAEVARAAGCRVEVLGDHIVGEAAQIGRAHGMMAQRTRLAPGSSPLVILSGGELTVTQHGPPEGLGGPNAEYLLAMGMELAGDPHIWAIACDTGGIDGATTAAGAMIGPDFPQLVLAAGSNPRRALATHDAHGFFAAIAGQVITGPTLTYVNDFRATLILPDQKGSP